MGVSTLRLATARSCCTLALREENFSRSERTKFTLTEDSTGARAWPGAAASVLRHMATFESAGVSRRVAVRR